MACATLKRSMVDLDQTTTNQRPNKRRRFDPFQNKDGGFDGNYMPPPNLQNTSRFDSQPSAFADVSVSKLSPDKMCQNIRDEIKRLYKRKQLPYSVSSVERMQDSESSGSEMSPDSPPNILRTPEKGLFTFKQVQLICERMLNEREEQLRSQYDAVLTNKLAEQYDAFVKFTYDQIQKRYEAAPSYLS